MSREFFPAKAKIKDKIKKVEVLFEFKYDDVPYVTARRKGKFIIIPQSDVVQNEVTYFDFGGNAELVMPEGVSLKVGDPVRVTFQECYRRPNGSIDKKPGVSVMDRPVARLQTRSDLKDWLSNRRPRDYSFELLRLEINEPRVLWEAPNMPAAAPGEYCMVAK